VVDGRYLGDIRRADRYIHRGFPTVRRDREVTAPGVSQTNTTDYSEDSNTRSAFLAGAALSGLAILLGIVFVVTAMMADKQPSMRRIASLSGIFGFVLALLGTLYVMAALPGAVNADSGGGGLGLSQFSGFWGSDSTTFFGITATVTWSAGWAWYVVLIGAVVFLIGGILVMRAAKTAPAAPSTMQAPPESRPMP